MSNKRKAQNNNNNNIHFILYMFCIPCSLLCIAWIPVYDFSVMPFEWRSYYLALHSRSQALCHHPLMGCVLPVTHPPHSLRKGLFAYITHSPFSVSLPKLFHWSLRSTIMPWSGACIPSILSSMITVSLMGVPLQALRDNITRALYHLCRSAGCRQQQVLGIYIFQAPASANGYQFGYGILSHCTINLHFAFVAKSCRLLKINSAEPEVDFMPLGEHWAPYARNLLNLHSRLTLSGRHSSGNQVLCTFFVIGIQSCPFHCRRWRGLLIMVVCPMAAPSYPLPVSFQVLA